MCHHVWVEWLSQECESEVAASPAEWEPQMEGEASLDPGVKGAAFAGRWCPDCLPLLQYQENLRVGVMLCAGETGPP